MAASSYCFRQKDLTRVHGMRYGQRQWQLMQCESVFEVKLRDAALKTRFATSLKGSHVGNLLSWLFLY